MSEITHIHLCDRYGKVMRFATITPEALDIIEAVVEGRYTAAEVVTFEGHTYQLLRVDFDPPCPTCEGDPIGSIHRIDHKYGTGRA